VAAGVTAFAFKIAARDGAARAGALQTPHGVIHTPAFMTLATAGTTKALTFDQVKAAGAEIVLGNTYHLMLRPGAERIARLGGLHAFMQWDRAILTDSGGFQVMSLAKLRRIDDAGVTFQSHVDGARHVLSPERAIEIQADLLQADIVMQLDECVALPAAHEAVAAATTRSLRWAERSKRAFGSRAAQNLFAIVQGGVDPALRRRSAETLVAEGFDGYAVGGLAVGEPRAELLATLEATMPFLPETRPRYLMGVGKPIDIVEAVARGVDLFDCVIPTRSGRHGQAWSDAGPINLKNAQHQDDPAPLDPALDCPASRNYSKAYLAHLIRAGEILGQVLLSWHNVAYYQSLMRRLRAAIDARRIGDFAAEFRAGWRGD
jgi:queuine tRNA-ribosyltransferase